VSARAVPRAHAARVAAQAKINLRLRILARETSGYHQLETLFLRLALADDVLVRVTDGGCSLDVAGDVDPRQLGPAERNLALRAASAYVGATGWPAGYAIELTKQIPVGGGLGGGSADAGAVLRALDAMAPAPIGEPRLLAIAAQLGADVPFLTSTSAFALAWGRGERLLTLSAPDEREVLLVLPPFAVNTTEAYGWLVAARDAGDRHDAADAVLDPLEASSLPDWASIARLATNDFERVVAARHPNVDSILAQLRALGCAPAMLSGSGSSIFGVLPPATRVDVPRFEGAHGGPAPRVLLTHTAAAVAPVVPVA
jgi:4-diphosphocytidyl-2-C-methyl-D-erythritol kinase